MLTFGKTGCFAFRSNCCVNDLGVRSQSYFFLFYENLFTNRALGSIGETGFGAGGSLAGNGYFGVIESRFKCFSTYGASLIVLTSCLVGIVFVVAFSINCDAINSNLSVRQRKVERINCCCKCNRYRFVVNSYVCACSFKRCFARTCIRRGVTCDNHLSHTGVSDD